MKEDLEEFMLFGNYHLRTYYEEYEREISHEFYLKIHIYKNYPKNIPEIEECKDIIPDDFHKNGDYFCLGVPEEMLLFAKRNGIGAFLNKYLKSYLSNFLFYSKYGIFPFEERSHGIEGISEFYIEYFQTKDLEKAIKLLGLTISNENNKNKKCPCESKKKFKNCHMHKVNLLKKRLPKKLLQTSYNWLVIYNGKKKNS